MGYGLCAAGYEATTRKSAPKDALERLISTYSAYLWSFRALMLSDHARLPRFCRENLQASSEHLIAHSP